MSLLEYFVCHLIMIRRGLTSWIRLIYSPTLPFCNKADILKTYLEIIPPHRIYELREKKDHRLDNSLEAIEKQLENNTAIDHEALKTVLKQVKRRTNMIPLPTLTRIAEFACRSQNTEHAVELRKAYTKIIRRASTGAEKLDVEQLVDLVFRLVKLGKKQYELMKEVEKVIIEDRVKIDFPLIRKILYSYTHLNQGSAVLYAHISKTLTICQHEFRPLELAESAYMLSKVSENAKGGYGVFAIAEKHVEAVLPRLNFSELARASSYLLTQDLGSNKFQTKLEEALYNTFPAKDRIKITDFVVLLKSTSGYFFKFKEGALLSMLKTSTLRLAKYATLQQFQDILWSWGRLGKGDAELWECLSTEVKRHLPQWRPRQLAFAYHSLCCSPHTSPDLLTSLEQRFLSLPLDQINEHYLIKFLMGMQKKKFYDTAAFLTVSSDISRRIQQLSNNELVAFLKVINESDLDFTSKQQVSELVAAVQGVARKLEPKLHVLKLTQITELLYMLIKLQVDESELVEKCFQQLDIVINIPKSAFIKSFFACTIREKYTKALEYVPILEELTKYGPIGYFFPPHEFPLLAYCILNIAVNGTNVAIAPNLVRHTQTALLQINPVILNAFVRKGYEEAIALLQKYNMREREQ